MRKNALLIGVEMTIMPGFSDQKIGVKNDIQLISNLLISNEWSQNNIKILTAEQDLRKENILGQILEIASSAVPGDKLLIYFSGHGVEQSLPDSTVQSLVLYDSYLYDYEIRVAFRKTDPAVILLAVFDCCHSGSIIDFSPRINFPATIYYGACQDSEEAISRPDGSQFTSEICNIKLQAPDISYLELNRQLLNNIHEPQPVCKNYRVSKTYLEQNVAFL